MAASHSIQMLDNWLVVAKAAAKDRYLALVTVALMVESLIELN